MDLIRRLNSNFSKTSAVGQISSASKNNPFATLDSLPKSSHLKKPVLTHKKSPVNINEASDKVAPLYEATDLANVLNSQTSSINELHVGGD